MSDEPVAQGMPSVGEVLDETFAVQRRSLQRIEESQKELERSQGETNERLGRLEESHRVLEESHRETNERLGRLEESHGETNERLGRLEQSQKVLEESQRGVSEAMSSHREILEGIATKLDTLTS